jgi:hypothetical protein
MLDHQRGDRWDLNHPMPQWLWILSRQQGVAMASGVRVVRHHLIHPLDRQQLDPGFWMARLAAGLAATWRVVTAARKPYG